MSQKKRKQRGVTEKTLLRRKAARKAKKVLWNSCRVYTLRDPRDNSIHYVGQTRHFDVKSRLTTHLRKLETERRCKKKLNPCQVWISSLLEAGMAPEIHIIDNTGIWDVTEAVWIDRLLREGHPLKNVAGIVPTVYL